MYGDIPPLPNTPTWRDAQLKPRDDFTVTVTFLILQTYNLFIYTEILSEEKWQFWIPRRALPVNVNVMLKWIFQK